MDDWIKEHIDIWFNILTDENKDCKSKVVCLTSLVGLVKREIEK